MRLGRNSIFMLFAAVVSLSSIATAQQPVTPREVEAAIAANVLRVPEFVFIREEAERLGMKAYLFGGTAASFAHYVRDDLGRVHGEAGFDAGRLDYDFTSIFRSTQDLDIVIDGPMAKIEQLQALILAKYPTFAGDRGVKWELRSLREAKGSPSDPGFKEALLGDRDFLHQNSDSASTGLIEVTTPQREGHVIMDLRDQQHSPSRFLIDVTNRHLTFYRSPEHFTTARAKAGMNPEVFSVIRALTKAFQFDLSISPEAMKEMKEIVSGTNFEELARGSSGLTRRLVDMGKKIMMHSLDVERSWVVLEELGLRSKLMMFDSPQTKGSLAWWMNKAPLPSKPLGQGDGKTAAEIAAERGLPRLEVAHATRSMESLESIERSRRHEANFFISRQNAPGEMAVYGDGVYTMLGKSGAFEGPTSRMVLNPNAREGSDFKFVASGILILNKNAVSLISTPMMHSEEEIVEMLKTKEGQEALIASGLLHRALRRYPTLMDRIFFGNVPFSQSIDLMRNSEFIKVMSNNDTLRSLIKIRMEKKGLPLSEFVKILDDVERMKWLKERQLVNTLREGVMNRLMSAPLTLPRYLQIMRVLDRYAGHDEFLSAYQIREFSERVENSMRKPTPEDLRLAKEIIERSSSKVELWYAAFRMGVDLKVEIAQPQPPTETELATLESYKDAARPEWKRSDYRTPESVTLAFSWIRSLARRATTLEMFAKIVADGRVVDPAKYDTRWLDQPFFDKVRGVRGELTPYAVYLARRESDPEGFKRIFMHDGDYMNQGLFAFMANAKSVAEILDLIVDPSKKDYRSSLFGARNWIVPNIDKVLALKPTPDEFVKLVRGELWQNIEGHADKTLAYAHTPEMFAAVLDTHFTISINGDKNKIPGMRALWVKWMPKFFAMNPSADQIKLAHDAAKHGDSADLFDAELLKYKAPTPQVARQKYKAMVRTQSVRCEQVFQ